MGQAGLGKYYPHTDGQGKASEPGGLAPSSVEFSGASEACRSVIGKT